MSDLSVVIADDHPVFREGLIALIERQPGISIVAQATDGVEAIEACAEHQPAVAILDLSMPRCSGTQSIEAIRERCPRTRVLVLTMHDDPRFLRSALAAGAAGYVVKQLASRDILEAIRSVHQGKAFIRISLADDTLRAAVNAGPARGARPAIALSDRERQVLRLVALGYTNQEAAEELGVGKKSIDSYRHRLQQKLGFSRRSEIVRYALEMGILDVDR